MTRQRNDQRRVMITLSVDRYNELKKTARAYSLSMTGIINALIGDYLKAERDGGADMTGAGLVDRVDSLEKRLATLSAMLAPKRTRKRRKSADAPKQTIDAPIMEPTETNLTKREPDHAETLPDTFGGDGTTLQLFGKDERLDDKTAPPIVDAPPTPTTRDAIVEQHERAATIANREPERVAIASTLARESKPYEQPKRRVDESRNARTYLERRQDDSKRLDETKRRAAAYALHGIGSTRTLATQGAY